MELQEMNKQHAEMKTSGKILKREKWANRNRATNRRLTENTFLPFPAHSFLCIFICCYSVEVNQLCPRDLLRSTKYCRTLNFGCP